MKFNSKPGLAFRMWIVLIFSMPSMYAQPAPQIQVQKTSPSSLRLSWQTDPNAIYRLSRASTPNGPWIKNPSVIAGNGNVVQTTISMAQPQQYFRVEARTADALVTFTNEQRVSEMLTFDITPDVARGAPRYVALYDIFQGSTNFCGMIDLEFQNTRTFSLNTRHLRNGRHLLQMEVVGGFNSGWSDLYAVNVTNSFTVVSQVNTESRRYLEVQPYATRGTYKITVLDSQGQVVQQTNRTIQGALSLQNTISITDGRAHYTNNYASPYFTYNIEVTPEGGTMTSYSFVSPTVSSFEYMEGTAIAEIDPEVSPNTYPMLSEMMLDVMEYHSQMTVPFLFETLSRDVLDGKWNAVSAEGYGLWNQYLLGEYSRGPSHGHFLSPGGAGFLGSWGNDPGYGISPATLSSLAASNRMTYVFFDGFNMPKVLVHLLTGITDLNKRSSRTDLVREGRRPKLVFYWKDTPFPYQVGSDVSAQHREFVKALYDELWKPGFDGLPGQTIDTVIQRMKVRFPNEMSRLGIAGEFNGMFIDETFTHY